MTHSQSVGKSEDLLAIGSCDSSDSSDEVLQFLNYVALLYNVIFVTVYHVNLL